MGGKVPDAPDYEGAAERQAESSKEVTNMQTWANRPEQITPWGTTNWQTNAVTDPATGQRVTRWTQNTRLNPMLQRALEEQQRLQTGRSELAGSMLDRAVDEYSPMVDWGSYTPLTSGLNPRSYDTQDIQRSISDPGAVRTRAEDALYSKATSRLDPMWDNRADDLRQQLYDQGLREGDTAYSRAMDDFNRNRTDAYDQATFGAIISGGEEAQRQLGMEAQAGSFYNAAADQALRQQMQVGGQEFGEEMSAANYGNMVRQQQIAEEMQRRGFSLNEINAILYGQQVGMPQMPGFTNAERAESTQYLNAAQMQGQHELDAFNAQQQALQGMMSGVSGFIPS